MKKSILTMAICAMSTMMMGTASAAPASTATPTAATAKSGSTELAVTPEVKKLNGYVPGARVVKYDITNKQLLDSISQVVYKQVVERDMLTKLHMDILRDRNTKNNPAIVYFSGGGFTTANEGKDLELRTRLAKAGFVVAAVEYRAVPTKFPGILEDGKAAVRYLRAHAAEYGIDPARIGVMGDSAGGYLTEMMATTNGERKYDVGDNLDKSSDVQAALSRYGISDVSCIGEGLGQDIAKVHASPASTESLLVNGPAFGNFAGAGVLETPEKSREASPIGHVDGSEPPMALYHGSADVVVSPWQSAHLYEALKKKGVDVTYTLVEGAHHGDTPWYQPAFMQEVIDFFTAKLGQPGGEKTNSGINY